MEVGGIHVIGPICLPCNLGTCSSRYAEFGPRAELAEPVPKARDFR